MDYSITAAEYKKLHDYVYEKLGIEIDAKNKETITVKIVKLMNRHGIKNPDEYINYIIATSDDYVIQEFFNEITINTTEFFRESIHFDYIKKNINLIIDAIPKIKEKGEIRIWSAPCSSGEEPVTISIVMKECLPQGISAKILATDISEKVLTKATKGIYTENECRGLSRQHMLTYFKKQPDGNYRVNDDIKKCVTYRLFNLMDDFKFMKGFDMVFCRNLLMYFDADVQQNLINKFYDVIVPNGMLFIGHAENMINKKHRFKYIQTAVYKK